MAHVATITIDHTKVAADLTDYPVLVVANGDAGWAELYALATEGGGDIRVFKSDDTTELPREIVSFTVAGEAGEIHIKYSGTLSSTVDTDIHIYADGTSGDYATTATYGRNNVWTDFLAVYHLNGLTDSKGTYDLTNNSAVTFGSTNAKIGNASIYNQTNANYLYHNSAYGRSYNSAYSLSLWLYTDDNPTTDYDIAEILVTGNPGQRMRMLYEYNGGSRRIRMYQNTSVGTTFFDISGNIGATTARYDITFSGTAIYMYKNATATHSNVSNNANGGSLGGTTRVSLGNTSASGYTAPLKGKIDEFRYRSSVTSGNTITTEYNNQNSPSTFYSVAAISGSIPQAVTANVRTSSTIAVKKTFKRTLTAPVRTSATITLRKTFKRTLTAAVAASSTIARANLRFITMTASLVGSSTIATESINAVLLATNAAVSASITLKKTFKRTLTAATNTGSTITSRSIKLVVLTAAIRASATLLSVRTFYQTLTATVRGSAAITRGNVVRTVVLSAILSIKGSLGEYFYKRKYEKEEEDYKRKY